MGIGLQFVALLIIIIKQDTKELIEVLQLSSALHKEGTYLWASPFLSMNTYVHADKTWYYITKESETYYLTSSESLHIAQLEGKHPLQK